MMHNTHNADSVSRRPEDQHPGQAHSSSLSLRLPHPAARRRTGAGAPTRAFSVIELAISLGIFLLIATVVSIAIGRSMSATTAVRTDRVVTETLTGQLDKMSALDYANLLTGNFTVPDPCSGSVSGIAGQSCVRTTAGTIKVGYSFQSTGTGGPVDTVCDPNASPTRSNTDSGFVGLCANVVAINGQPAANLDLSEMSQSTSTRVNAPTPGYDVTKAMVRMTLAGSSTDVAALSGRSVFVSKAADPTQVVGSGVISGTTAYVNVPGSGGTACTATAPCVVALAPSTTPTMADGLALSSSLSAGPGQSTTTAAGLTTTLSGGAFTAAPGRVTDVAATVFRPGVASVNLLAADGSTSAANPIAGSVCLWATFPDGASKRTVPVCNTTTAGRLVLDTYNPTWDTNPASALRYPFPVGVPIQLSVDHPDGVCYYAPGMVAYQVAAATANTIANWPAVAQCTSYTWGEPTSGLDTPITLVSGQTVHRDVVWRSGAPFDAAAPAAGLSGRGSLWSSPRLSRECSLDATCSTTPAKALEWTHCRSQFCYGNGAGGEPVVVTPGTKVVPNPSSGAFGPYEIQVADPEGDAFTAAAGAAGAGTTDLRSWGLTWSTSSTGTYSAWPAAGATLLGTGSGTRSIFIKFTRPPADTTTASLGLDLSDNVAPVGTRSEVVTFVNSTDLTSLAVDDVTIAQGGSANTTVTATNLAGTAASGKTITVTGAPAGLTLSSPTTDATGTASLALNATGAVAAGTYQLTATSPAATPRTFNVTVKPAAGTISLTAAPGAQGTPGTLTAAVTDRAGNAMPGVVVSFKVVDASGATSNRVYPQNTGCSTAASGSCSVPVTTAADAPAGNYQAYASSGTAGVGPVTYTVAQTPTTATGIAGTTPRVVRGSSSTSLTVEVLDGAGAPVTGKSLTFGTDTVVTSWSPTSATTTAQGRATSTVTVAAAAPLGSRTFPVTVAGKTLQVPVVIADVTYSLTYPTIAFDQASTATFALTARDNNNAAVPATPITLTTNNPGLQVPASVTTDGSGVAQVPLTARAGLPAGQYTLTAVLAGTQFQIPVTVRQVLSSATVAGVVDQGKTFSSLVVTLLDASGTPVPATATTLAFPSAPNLVMNPPTGTTDSSGQVTVTVNDQGPTRAGLYPLTVSSGTFSTTVTVTVRATPTTLTVTPSQVDVANGGKVRVQASLTDAVGAPIPSMALSDTGFGTATFLPEALVANLPGSDLDTGAAVTSTGSVAYAQANSARDGYVAKVTGAGAATATLETSSRTPFDPTTLYRVTARVRVTTDATGGNRPVYLGVAARSSSGTLIPGNGTQHWAVQSTPATSDGWVTLTGYFQGYGTPGTSSDPAAPAALTAGTSTIAATLSLNNGAAGSGNAVWEVDYLQLDAVTLNGTSDSQPPATDARGISSFYLVSPASPASGMNGTGSVQTASGNLSRPVVLNVAPRRTQAALDTLASGGAPFFYWQLDNSTDTTQRSFADRTQSQPSTTPLGSATVDGYTPGSKGVDLGPGDSWSATAPGRATGSPVNAITVAAWLRPDPGAGLNLRKGTPTASTVGFAAYTTSDTSLTVSVSDGTTLRTATLTLPAGSTAADWRADWTHVAVRYDGGTGVAAVLVNGVSVASATLGTLAGNVTTGTPLQVGATGTGAAYTGLLDDVAVVYAAAPDSTIATMATRWNEDPVFSHEMTSTAGLTFVTGAAASATVLSDASARDGKALRWATGTAGPLWLRTSGSFDYDPTKTYKVTARLRVTGAPGNGVPRTVYVGVAGLDANGDLLNASGVAAETGQYFRAAEAATPVAADGWVVYTGYFKGLGAPGAAVSTGAATQVTSPLPLHAGVARFSPLVAVGQADGGGATYDVDYVDVTVSDR